MNSVEEKSESISKGISSIIVSKLQSSTVQYSFADFVFCVLISLVFVPIFGGEVGGVFEKLETIIPNKTPAKMFLDFKK